MLNTYEFIASYMRARFGDDERGASLVEYALLVALIAVVCIVAVTFLMVPVNLNRDSYTSLTGEPSSSPVSNVSSAEKRPRIVLSTRPSAAFSSSTNSVAVPPLPTPPPSYLNSTRRPRTRQARARRRRS